MNTFVLGSVVLQLFIFGMSDSKSLMLICLLNDEGTFGVTVVAAVLDDTDASV